MSIDIPAINAVISSFFSSEQGVDLVPAKKLMPEFIAAGIFKKDIRKGLPIRDVLKTLDREDRLEDIPSLHYVRKGKDTFWYFKRDGHTPAELEVDRIPAKENTKRQIHKRADNDKQYVMDLCDRTLRETGLRNHTFDWLVGDLHRNGRTRSKLPCDAYYSKLKLIVDYIERPLLETVSMEEVGKGTVDNRAERDRKRTQYVERKKEILPAKGYRYEVLEHSLFKMDENGGIIRDRSKDMKRIHAVLGHLTEN